MKNLKTLTLIMLFIALIAIPIATTKQVAASTPPNNPGNIADDILYLRRSPKDNNLTRESPTSPTAAGITVSGDSSITVMWINGTPVPTARRWNIDEGEYNFTFWMNATHNNIVASVTFTFGYIDATGKQENIVSATKTGIQPGQGSPKKYDITRSAGMTEIPSGSRLFLKVVITVSGPRGHKATFWYDGVNQQTQIKTPGISEIVPEFPLGVVFLPSTLLLAYLISRKHSVRFRV